MNQHTFVLMTTDRTHYMDVARGEGDQRPWRDLVLDHALEQGLIELADCQSATVLPAVRPAPPHAHWR